MSLRHSGCSWPNGPVTGGNSHILALPSSDLLMLATEGRYHYDEAVRAGKRVLWRSIPRIGKRPAELGWSPARFVAETINLTDAPTLPITDFIWANELDLNYERGDSADDWSGLASRYALIGGWALSVVQSLKQWSPETRIHWPAFTPDHQALDFLDSWMAAADACAAVDFHAYDNLGQIAAQYSDYRSAFPDTPLCLTEWHCRGDVAEERRVLEWLAETMKEDPLFEAAYFYIWRWWQPAGWWSDDWDIEHNPDRLSLFMDPPAVKPAPEPQPEPIPPEPIMPAWEHWSAEELARFTECPLDAVTENWPRLVEQLTHCGINDKDVQAAMLGTVAIESASTFRPVREAFYLGEPDPAEEYRKTLRYYPYYGRGYIQLTWQSNYAVYGPKIAELWGAGGQEPDFDLVGNPDNALNPDISAAVSALYFRDTATVQGYSLPDAARAHDWEWVRRLVQGGTAGLDRLTAICSALLGQTPETLTYNQYQAPERQVQDWACSIRAATWALKSVGVAIDAAQLQDEMVPGAVTPAQGLLDARGYGLAAAIGRHVPQSTKVEVLERASWDDLLQRAGRGPLCVGSISLYHWLNVAYLDPAGHFIAPNPAPAWQGIGDDLTREEFARWAPWSAVFVEVTPAVVDTAPTYEQLANLEGVAYHDDGTVIPALLGAKASGDWSQVDAVVSFLRSNDPHRAA